MYSTAVLLLLGSDAVRADQPVNCLRTHLESQVWNFHVSQNTSVINLFQTQEVCTHQLPNRVQLIDKSLKWQFAAEDVWQVSLDLGYKATASFCANGDLAKCDRVKVHGKWQDYYDQAFLVELDNGLRFLANFRYELKDDYLKKKGYTSVAVADRRYLAELIPDTENDTKKKFNSRCGETMIGFVQHTEANLDGNMANH